MTRRRLVSIGIAVGLSLMAGMVVFAPGSAAGSGTVFATGLATRERSV